MLANTFLGCMHNVFKFLKSSTHFSSSTFTHGDECILQVGFQISLPSEGIQSMKSHSLGADVWDPDMVRTVNRQFLFCT